MDLIPITAFPREMCRAVFMTDRIPTSALQADPRILYAAFIPDEHYPQSPNDLLKIPLLVAIHGTSRAHSRHLDAWREFALQNRCAVVAPLFPCLVASPIDIDGYHYLGRPPTPDSLDHDRILKAKVHVPKVYAKVESRDVRYDLLLLSLLDEVAIRWPAIDTSKVLLTGFSGGGQFVHRFMYLHPERLLAVSVGAPGSVTALDFRRSWPAGLKDVEALFGQQVDVEALKQLPILASVGGEDVSGSTGEVRRLLKGENFGREEEVGKTRVQRLKELVEHWRSLSLDVEFEIVPGAKHEMEKVNVVAVPFMARQLERYWREQARADSVKPSKGFSVLNLQA